MILINSANFKIAEFDFSKEVFFVGSNAGGKTTSTKALHFLYNANGKKLGISTQKDSFSKHYFPYDNSYIIYTFEGFFIIAFKRSGEIVKYFCKQDFDRNRIILLNEKLADHEDIIKYVKDKDFVHYRPKGTDEYMSILYGQNAKYLDFSISSVKNYETFIEVLNLVFNVDKAIVDSNSIKRAIQKSLNKADETVVFDFEKYRQQLRGFERNYHFFKVFDANRKYIGKAVDTKNILLELEDKESILLKLIKYRAELERTLIDTNNKRIVDIGEEEKNRGTKKTIRERKLKKSIPSLRNKIGEQQLEIKKIEALKEMYSYENFEENSEIANRLDGINKELQTKQNILNNLLNEQTDVLKAYDEQINILLDKINKVIPRETRDNIYNSIEREKGHHKDDINAINSEYIDRKTPLTSKIDSIEKSIKSNKEADLVHYDKFIITKKEITTKKDWQISSKNQELTNNAEAKKSINKNIDTIENKNLDLGNKKRRVENEYSELRTSNAKILNKKRNSINRDIKNIISVISTEPNTLKEFLSNEVVNWEKEVYPLIDKSLLGMSIEKLKPRVLREDELFGIELDCSALEGIPTYDEATKQIIKLKKEKFEYLFLFREEDRINKVDKLEKISHLDAQIDENNTRLENYALELKSCIEKELQLNRDLKDINDSCNNEIEKSKALYEKQSEQAIENIRNLKIEKKELDTEISALNNSRNVDIIKCDKRLEENEKIIKKREDKVAIEKIEDARVKIKKLEIDRKEKGENEAISSLKDDVSILSKEYKKSILAEEFLIQYEKSQPTINQLQNKIDNKIRHESFADKLEKLLQKDIEEIKLSFESLKNERDELTLSMKKYKEGERKLIEMGLTLPEYPLETDECLLDVLEKLTRNETDYKSKKADLKSYISRFSQLEKYPMIELNFNISRFDDVDSIKELTNILESIYELDDFDTNKYESQKKRSHRDFDAFLQSTIPQKISNFNNLESDFMKEVSKINKNLSNADFGVIRDIKLDPNPSKSNFDSIRVLFERLSSKIKESTGLYTKESLFYFDTPKSIENIEEIVEILDNIKKKGSDGRINLFDAIDLSISYVENGKRRENLTHIKDDSSSGGNILLKVAIAMSILNIYTKDSIKDTPFYIIIDEVSRLQHENQNLLRDYINSNGFKTLYITPDASYPNPDKAIYYIFKSIINEGDYLEATQMNII